MPLSAKSMALKFIHILLLPGFILSGSFTCFSQKIEIENKFHIKQEDKSIVFHVLDADDSQLKKYNPDKNYFWFKSQKILVTQGGSSGSLLNGDYESFYKNNQLAEKGLFKKGLKQGVWKCWNPAGILVHQENWSKGIQTGKQLYYSKEGILQKTISYKANQTRVISRDTTILKTRKALITTVNDSTGKLISQSRYANFQLDGTQIVRDQNDSLVKTVYKKGVLIPEKVKPVKEKETSNSEKRTFKQKMGNLWEKLQFWKKFKKKEKADSPPKTKKEPKAEKQPKEKKKRTE